MSEATSGLDRDKFSAVPNPAVLRIYGAKNGVPITNVRPDSPAAKAGLQGEDTITAVNGKPIKSGVCSAWQRSWGVPAARPPRTIHGQKLQNSAKPSCKN